MKSIIDYFCVFSTVIILSIAQKNALAMPSDDMQIAVPTSSQITKNIITVASKYVESISCSNETITPQMIAPLTPWTEDNEISREDAVYAVVWGGDIECGGGSGSFNSHILIIKIGAGSSFYVVPALSSPLVEFNVGDTVVTRLVGNTNDTLMLEGDFYRENDGRCCPSIKNKRFLVRVDETGNWAK